MRRLRAIAAIVALFVIWLGFSVARQIAAEREANAPQKAEDAIPAAPGEARPSRASSRPSADPGKLPNPAAGPSLASIDVAGEPDQAAASALVSAAAGTPFVNPLPGPSAQEPFRSASFNAPSSMTGGGGSSRRGNAGSGAAHAGGSGGGFGGGGGSTATSSDAGGGDAESGNGRPEQLGRRLSSDSPESSVDAGAPGKSGENGSNGNSDSNGNGDSNGDRGDSNGNGDSNGSNGSSGGNGSTGSGGTDGSNGADGSSGGNDGGTGDDSDSGADTARTAALSLEGTDGARSIPEPGSILMGLGAAAVVARRRRR